MRGCTEQLQPSGAHGCCKQSMWGAFLTSHTGLICREQNTDVWRLGCWESSRPDANTGWVPTSAETPPEQAAAATGGHEPLFQNNLRLRSGAVCQVLNRDWAGLGEEFARWLTKAGEQEGS